MKLLRLLLICSGAGWLGGCATNALWQDGNFASFHEPRYPPNLCLFEAKSRGDVLVEYDEAANNKAGGRRRAYWLFQNIERTEDRCKPRFLPSKIDPEFHSIPLFAAEQAAQPAQLASRESLYAVVATNGFDFELYAVQASSAGGSAQRLGRFQLPVYQDGSARTKKVLLTPLTVAADLTIVGSLIAVTFWPAGWDIECPR